MRLLLFNYNSKCPILFNKMQFEVSNFRESILHFKFQIQPLHHCNTINIDYTLYIFSNVYQSSKRLGNKDYYNPTSFYNQSYNVFFKISE